MASFLVNRFLFHPTRATEFWQPPPPGLAVQDVEIKTDDGTSIHAWWSAPEGWSVECGAVLYCHGNAGNLSTRAEGIRRWQEALGIGVLIFDYPGYGRSGGRPSEAGCYAAGQAAYNWLTETKEIRSARVILYGGSLGGGVAIELGVHGTQRALVLVSAFTSVLDMGRQTFPWLPLRWLVGNCFNNLDKIGRVRGPIVIAHGTADELVPFEQGQRLFAAAPEPKLLFPMAGYSHQHTPGPEFYAALKDFLTIHAP